MRNIIVKVICRYCLDVLDIHDPYPIFSYIIDSRSDIDSFLRYCTCPNCGKKKMELHSVER
jgi:hypothetical protein